MELEPTKVKHQTSDEQVPRYLVQCGNGDHYANKKLVDEFILRWPAAPLIFAEHSTAVVSFMQLLSGYTFAVHSDGELIQLIELCKKYPHERTTARHLYEEVNKRSSGIAVNLYFNIFKHCVAFK